MTPHRQDLWNLPAWMYPAHWLLAILCGALVVYGLWRRVRLCRMGQPTVRTDQVRRRIGGLLRTPWASDASCPNPILA